MTRNFIPAVSALWFCLACLMLPGARADAGGQPNSLSEQEQRDGWRLLFDGVSLAGWHNYGSRQAVQKWQVEEGTLMLAGGTVNYAKTLSHWLLGTANGDLIYSAQKFSDFELSLQWKISENGNSGIFYLVADEQHKAPSETGLEMQVLDNEGHADGQILTHRAGDLYDMISASPETVRPPGEWNDVLIRVSGPQVEHWLNDEKVLSFTRGSPEWQALLEASKYKDMPDHGKAEAGFLVLQDHGDAVWYRNIKVREL